MIRVVNVQPNTITEVIRTPNNTKYAIVQVAITNISNNDATINLYLCPANQPANDNTLYLKNLNILAGDTFMFNVEKLLLNVNESIRILSDQNVNVFVIFEIY